MGTSPTPVQNSVGTVQFGLTCTGAGGATAFASAPLTVTAPAGAKLPTVVITATDGTKAAGPNISVRDGSSVTINWAVQDATSCTGIGPQPWTGAKANQGTYTTGPLAATSADTTYQYRLDCQNGSKRETSAVKVSVLADNKPPKIVISSAKQTISSGLVPSFSSTQGGLSIGVADYCSAREDPEHYLYVELHSELNASFEWVRDFGPTVQATTLPLSGSVGGPYDLSVQARYQITGTTSTTEPSDVRFIFEADDVAGSAVGGPSFNRILPAALPRDQLNFAACGTTAGDIDIFIREPSGNVISAGSLFDCSSGSCSQSINGGSLPVDVRDGSAFEVVGYPGAVANGDYCLGVRNNSSTPSFVAIRGYDSSNPFSIFNIFFAIKLDPAAVANLRVYQVSGGRIVSTRAPEANDPHCVQIGP